MPVTITASAIAGAFAGGTYTSANVAQIDRDDIGRRISARYRNEVVASGVLTDYRQAGDRVVIYVDDHPHEFYGRAIVDTFVTMTVRVFRLDENGERIEVAA